VSTTTTRQLARFIAASRPGDIDEPILHEGRRALLNWIGSPVGACRHPIAEAVRQAFDPFCGSREAALLGRHERMDVIHAGVVNCAASNIYDYDDTHLPSVVHPTGPVAAALLALAGRERIDGRLFVHALVLGIEVQCRLGNALKVAPAAADDAWYMSGLTGGIGVAVAAGRVLGLDEQQMVWAIGHAVARAAGTRETHGTHAKNLVPAWTVEEGLRAVFLARAGVTTSETPLEGPRGMGTLYARRAHWPALVDGLGETWALRANAYKPFPSGIVTHGAITAALEIVQSHPLDPDAIEQVELDVPPICLALCGRRAPRTAVEGTFSVYHWVAIALRDRAIGIRHFSDACVNDPLLITLRDRVVARADDHLATDAARIVVRCAGGRVIEHRVDHALGSVERPLSDTQLDAKLHDLADPVLGAARTSALADAIRSLDSLPDAGDVVRLATPPT